MKITILNGNPQESSFNAYLNQIQDQLEDKGSQVTHILLRELPLKYWGIRINMWNAPLCT